jgi:redox-sensitive bicupin YhaK (pirin superfamily)
MQVTYLMEGAGYHEDFCGHKGELHPGDLQWMTAGRGIVHCEMPLGDKPMHGLQLWINLGAKDKMVQPAYQELKDADIPRIKKDGVWVKVIAGEALGIKVCLFCRLHLFSLVRF